MTTRYLEIDSTYRNRNDAETTGPSGFKIEIAQQVSRKDAKSSDDSISDYASLATWRRGNFTLTPSDTPSTSATRVATFGVQLKPVTITLPDGTKGITGHPDELHLTSMLSNSSAYNGILQPLDNYYWGCNISISNKSGEIVSNARITDYKYVGMNECHIKINSGVIMDVDYIVDIIDPTHAHDEDITALSRASGWEFVPGGPPYRSYVGAYLYHFDQGTTSNGRNIIVAHDKDRNMIQLDPSENPSVGATDELQIRGLLDTGSSKLFNKSLYNRFGGAAMSGASPDTKSIFGLENGENIEDVAIGDYLEITKPVEYAEVVASVTSSTVFTLTSAGDPTPSAQDDAYNGCTIRFIMTKGGTAGPDYASEDRVITDYVGSSRTVTINYGLSNPLTDYTVAGSSIKCLIISPIETRKISEKINLKIKTFALKSLTGKATGLSGSSVLNLLEYTDLTPQTPSLEEYINPSTSNVQWVNPLNGQNQEPFSHSGDGVSATLNDLFGLENLTQGAIGPLTGLYLQWYNGSAWVYGSIIKHTIKFERHSTGGRNGIRYLYNYLEMDSTFAAAWTTLGTPGAYETLQIVNLKVETPFTRNPICKYFTDTKLDMFSLLRYTRDNHQQMLIPKTITTNKKYRISLVNISLPNRELTNSKGGYITEYPYVYVKLRPKSRNFNTNSEIFFSNNNNHATADFRVIIDNVVDDVTTSHVSLRSDDMEIDNFRIDDQLFFAVYMPDGTLFQTVETDRTPPYEVKPYLQVSALFSFTEM